MAFLGSSEHREVIIYIYIYLCVHTHIYTYIYIYIYTVNLLICIVQVQPAIICKYRFEGGREEGRQSAHCGSQYTDTLQYVYCCKTN